MVKQYDIDKLEMEYAVQLQKYEELSKVVATLQSRQKERGKSLNRLWEETKKLRKEIVTLQKYCGKLTYDLSVLQLENRINIASANDFKLTPFLVKDILRQLVDKSGYYLGYDLLKPKHPAPSLTISGKEIKK